MTTWAGARSCPQPVLFHWKTPPEGAPLKDHLTRAYEYSDVWVQDARLVVLNARDAAARGAQVMTRTKVVAALPENGAWRVTLGNGEVIRARALINAAGLGWAM